MSSTFILYDHKKMDQTKSPVLTLYMNACVIVPLTYSHVDILEMDITVDLITVVSEGK